MTRAEAEQALRALDVRLGSDVKIEETQDAETGASPSGRMVPPCPPLTIPPSPRPPVP